MGQPTEPTVNEVLAGILRLIPDRANVACSSVAGSTLSIAVRSGGFIGCGPGIGSASAVREISSLRSPENSQISVIVRISATRPGRARRVPTLG